MRILFIRPNVVLPELFAGTELTTHGLCRSLIANGHEVVVAATTFAKDSPATVHHECGYPVVRAWNGYLAAVHAVRQFRPDVLSVSQAGSWLGELPGPIRGTPIVIYEHEASPSVKQVPLEIKRRAVFLANSASTAAHVSRECGVDSTIVRPLFGIDEYVGIKRGIPVLASSRGNLPATIGPGGMTLDPDDPFEHWLEKFDAIMNDAALYDDLSAKASAQGLDVVKDAKRAFETFERALHDAIAKGRS